MATYNFKKNTKLHVVRNNLRYTLDIYPDISFSQTFDETNVPVKTLHSQYDMFEAAVISKASPANFSFTLPILVENDLDVAFDLLMDYAVGDATLNTADLYVEANSEIFKLEKCVIESGIFQMVMNSVLTTSFSGTARKLSKHIGVLPGTLQTRSSTRTFTRITAMEVRVAGAVRDSIASVSIELKNNVQWIDFATIHNSLASGTVQFPEAFVVTGRTLSGTIQQYLTSDNNSTVQTNAVGVPISVKVGTPAKLDLLEVSIPSAVYTNRVEVQDLYTQSYDFRMISSPLSLTNVIKRI